MAVFGGLILTNSGRNLEAKAQLGKELKVKRVALGDGQMTTESMLTMKSLINETLSCEIKSLKLLEDNIVKVTFYLTNKNLNTGFTWREIGVIAEDPDTKAEILYCYGNARSNAEYISAKNGADILELNVSVDLIVSNAQNISAVINESLVFATKEELDELEGRIVELEKIPALLSNKVDKVEGKGLSSNDFTNEYKSALDNFNPPRAKNITLLKENWVLNETTEKYEYTYADDTITKNDYIMFDILDDEQLEAMLSAKWETANGSIKFTNDERVEIDVMLQLVIMRVKPKPKTEQEVV